jgi:hypothetical protein
MLLNGSVVRPEAFTVQKPASDTNVHGTGRWRIGAHNKTLLPGASGRRKRRPDFVEPTGPGRSGRVSSPRSGATVSSPRSEATLGEVARRAGGGFLGEVARRAGGGLRPTRPGMAAPPA